LSVAAVHADRRDKERPANDRLGIRAFAKKIISIRFDLRQIIDSNRFVRFDSPKHCRNPRGGREGRQPGWGPCTACFLAKYGCPTAQSCARTDDARSCVVIVTFVSAAVIRRSVVCQADANNQYNRIGRSHLGGNRIDSNRQSDALVGIDACSTTIKRMLIVSDD